MRRQPLPAKEAPHGYVTASELPEILIQEFKFPLHLQTYRVMIMVMAKFFSQLRYHQDSG